MDSHFIFVPGLLLIPVTILLSYIASWRYLRADSLLQQWAERNGCRLIQQDYRPFFRGPFFWTTSGSQMVYRVTVQDAQGRQRKGWVRCGGCFLGMLSDNVEVVWDDS